MSEGYTLEWLHGATFNDVWDAIEALRAERDAWQQECELRTEDYQRAYRREMDNAARAEKAEAENARLREVLHSRNRREGIEWVQAADEALAPVESKPSSTDATTARYDGTAVPGTGGDDGR